MKTILSLLLAAFTLNAFADTTNVSILDRAKAFAAKESGDLFGKETVVDFGVAYTTDHPKGPDDMQMRHGDWGLNFGVQQFPSRFVGIGLEAGIRNWNEVPNSVLDYTATTVALRVPIKRIALSAVGAVGREWSDGVYYFGCGPRLDIRLNKRIGLVSAARWNFRDEKPDSLRIDVAGSVAF